VYVAGSFSRAGNREAPYVARWGGTEWHALGNGLQRDSSCHGNSWENSEPHGVVRALTVNDGALYAGGCFGLPGTTDGAHHVARWDGTAWAPLGTVDAAEIGDLAMYDGDLYMVSNIADIESQLFRWQNEQWQVMETIEWGVINDLQAEPSGLVVAGRFDEIGGQSISNVARWDGSSWHAEVSGVYDEVHDLISTPNGLLAGGAFYGISKPTRPGGGFVARWRNDRWRRLTSHQGIGGASVDAIATDGLDTYVGGRFAWAGRVPARNAARWDGFRWHALGKGTDGQVRAISVDGSDVYAGGDFQQAGDAPAEHIARWSGTSWSALGSGVSDGSFDLAASNSSVYVLKVDSAGGHPVENAARWDGSSWNALNAFPELEAVAAGDGVTYALFEVDDPDGRCVELARRGTARWRVVGEPVCLTGSDLPLPIWQQRPVEGFAVESGRAYLSNVILPGDSVTTSLAVWGGNGWNALDASGPNAGGVGAGPIAIRGGNVFAGKYGILHWNGRTWQDLGNPRDFFQRERRIVKTLAAGPTGLFVGGSFRSIDGVRSSRFAQWRFAGGSDRENRSTRADWQLTSPAPNPFRGRTTVALYVPELSDVRVAVYDATGRRVAVLLDGPQPSGLQRVTWRPDGAASGTYFVRMTAEGGVARTQAVTLVR
jgi:hypothetical protein